MAVELFGSAVTRPDVIFCDTSFILDVLTDEVSQITSLCGTNATKLNRAAASAAFLHAYRGYGVQFISSPFAFSEVGHVITKNVHKSHGHKSWRAFWNADSPTCEQVYKDTMRLVRRAWRRISGYDIWFTLPAAGTTTAFGIRAEDSIVEAARLLKNRYMFLDWADAFHIASGLASGPQWYATTDQGWKSVAQINVFCDS